VKRRGEKYDIGSTARRLVLFVKLVVLGVSGKPHALVALSSKKHPPFSMK
jgi:hypothetical protein